MSEMERMVPLLNQPLLVLPQQHRPLSRLLWKNRQLRLSDEDDQMFPT
jgi:hypothetical protein